jgi:gas vesicle protein
MQGISKTQCTAVFVAGLAVGATAAFLLAPKTGAQVRKDLRRFSKRTMNQLDDLQGDIRDQISHGYNQVRKMITTA